MKCTEELFFQSAIGGKQPNGFVKNPNPNARIPNDLSHWDLKIENYLGFVFCYLGFHPLDCFYPLAIILYWC